MSATTNYTATYYNGDYYLDYGSVLGFRFNQRDVEREVNALMCAHPRGGKESEQDYIKRIVSLSSAPRSESQSKLRNPKSKISTGGAK